METSAVFRDVRSAHENERAHCVAASDASEEVWSIGHDGYNFRLNAFGLEHVF
jgi:hypothetical protein